MQNMNPILSHLVGVRDTPEPDALCLLVGSHLIRSGGGAIRIPVPDGLLILPLESRQAGRSLFETGRT